MFGELLAPVDYNLPGVLHYLQAEWRRFERERNEWTIERAELKARIALLEGERRGTEKLKVDMIKRVKMLEYALQQERRQCLESSIHHPPANVMDDKVEVDITGYPGPLYKSSQVNVPTISPVETSIDTKRREKSRQILKTCLQEINYLTSLPSKLPLTYTLAASIQNKNGCLQPVNKSSLNQQPSSTSISTTVQNIHPLSTNSPPSPSSTSAEAMISSNERPKPSNVPKTIESWTATKPSSSTQLSPLPPPTPPAIDESLGSAPTRRGTAIQTDGDNEGLSQSIKEKYNISNENMQKVLKNANKGSKKNRPSSPELHELDLNYLDVGSRQKIYNDSSKIWRNKMQFKGHLDSVRAVAFHPTEMLLASGSDDGTVKLINLEQSKPTTTKSSLHDDLDAKTTYRGHNNIITSVAISAEQERVYSSSLDGTLRVWRLPPSHHSTFSPIDPSLYVTTLLGHTDAIWDFKLLPDTAPLLASASADGTVKLWNTEDEQLQWSWDQPFGSKVAPTSLDVCGPDKLVVSYTNGKIQLYDIETGKVILAWTGTEEATQRAQINKVTSHPNTSLILSGHEDRLIKGHDLNSGKTIYSMSAHLDGVTSLDMVVDSALVSGGHDASIRLWDMKMNKTCIQELSAHRKKGDEGVLDVHFHRACPWMVSGGADGIVKVYQHGPFV